MVFLQASFDESGTHDGSPFTSIAGYISTIERWEAFTEKWQIALHDLGLDWFHMNEAEAMKSATYSSWSVAYRDASVQRMSNIVRDFTDFGLAVSVPQSEFKPRILDMANSDAAARNLLNHTYGLCFGQQVSFVNDLCLKHNVPRENVELVFAEVPKIGGKSREFWRDSWVEMGFQKPVFRDAREFAPLQAADMLAWRFNRNIHRPDEPVPERHKALMHRGYQAVFTPERIASMAEGLKSEMERVNKKWDVIGNGN